MAAAIARRSSCSARTSVAAMLSVLMSVAKSRSFLPGKRTRHRSTLSASDFLPSRSRRPPRPQLDSNAFARSWEEMRGGAQAPAAVADSSTPSPSTFMVESCTAASAHDHSNDKKGEGGVQTTEADEMRYAAIGVLHVFPAHGDNIILLSFTCNAGPNRQMYERWGVREATPVPAQTSFPNRHDERHVVSQVCGCLCHAIVLNLSQGTDIKASEELDDVLLGVAEGMVRRLKGTHQRTLSIAVAWEGSGEDQVSDSSTGDATKYIKDYVERALRRVWELQREKVLGAHGILPQCSVSVLFAGSSATNPTVYLAKQILRENSARQHNIVPRPLFGVLCKQVHDKIRRDKIRRGRGYYGYGSVTWEKLLEYPSGRIKTEVDTGEAAADNKRVGDARQQESAVRPTSEDLKRKVEYFVRMECTDAQDLLDEMERRMDEAFLESDSDGSYLPSPWFGRDADAIVKALSASFLNLLDDSVPELDAEWIKAKRIQFLKQVVETDIRQLFHLHLQNLRDHFGRCYELELDKSNLEGEFETIGYSPGGKSLLQGHPAARQAEQNFTKAALSAVPTICRPPGGELFEEFGKLFSYAEALRGLLEDMYEVTLAREMREEELADIMDESTGISKDVAPRSRVGLRELVKNMKARMKKRGPAKWYERLAMKFVVVGVNYIQGWIVLQTLRREASKRDLTMPKFPLF